MKNSNHRFCWPVAPNANQNNIIAGFHYRFTILTSRLIRMEYSLDGVFEDRASQTVFFRNFPKTDFTISREEGKLEIETEHLLLCYFEDEAFSEQSLVIKLKSEPGSTWHFGEPLEELGGTIPTLDGVNGETRLSRGVCSRNGFSILDDSERMLLDSDGWINVRRKHTYDGYFFGYGYDYIAAVKDFYRLTGAPTMLPKYALGNWWSRYHEYSQEEYTELVERFQKENVPFSVAVIDMDWHITDIPEDKKSSEPDLIGGIEGWTGYSWNEKLFPDHKAFLKYLHDNNMHTTLNLHPAQGVLRHESMYEEMAKASGIDPKSGKRIPLDILSPEAMENYFDVLLHPHEEAGVDFWWIDWQQGTDYAWIHEPNKNGELKDPREVLNPVWMLNHLHTLDIARNGKRPLYFSRYSGPGSQRYSVGFSGDTFVSWQSLDFQPYFTATASNIGYCWWSHDIGGHCFGYSDHELATRWVQYGVFSPINRLHSNKNQFQGKEPWKFDSEFEIVMKQYLRLRYRMLPYLYTSNYRAHNDLVPIIRPMYYSHPKASGAYEVKNQFWFGTELIVAPITEPRDTVDKLGRTKVWLPKGLWFDFFTGAKYDGKDGRIIDVFRTIDQYPVFAKAGAVVPMMEQNGNNIENPETMDVVVFPGADNCFTLYEDEGEYDRYKTGAYAETKMEQQKSEHGMEFTIYSPTGDISVLPKRRKYRIKLRGLSKQAKVTAFVDGKEVGVEARYDEPTHTIVIEVLIDILSSIKISVCGTDIIFNNDNCIERCFEILSASAIKFDEKIALMDIINNTGLNVRWKMFHIHKMIPEQNHLARALKEQLTLTEEEIL